MAQLKLDLSSFKSSGVYTVEVDNTITQLVDTDALRLVPGFSEKPPFNRPIFLNGPADKRKLYGSSIDTKLERKGCFYERFLDILLEAGPVIAINLLKTQEDDKVGFTSIPLSSSDTNEHNVYNERYDEFFDRSRFWTLSTTNLNQLAASKVAGGADYHTLQSSMYKSSIFNISNTGTSDITVFVVKDPEVLGYNITVGNWYENQEIPYGWMDKDDYMSDYFVKLIIVKGDWTNFKSLSTDVTWSKFFEEDGLKVSEINKFINADGVSVIGSWGGAIIPNFYNKAGNLVSLDAIVNSYADQTGVMVAFNESAMEALYNSNKTQVYDENYNGEADENESVASYKIDMVGRFITKDSGNVNFLSYSPIAANDIISTVEIDSVDDVKGNVFTVVPTADDKYLTAITVGTLIETESGVTRVIKKVYNKDGKYEITCLSNVAVSNGAYKTVEKNENGSITINGMTIAFNEEDTLNLNIDGKNYELYSSDDTHVVLFTEDAKSISVHQPLQNAFKYVKPVCLNGLKLSNKHRPGFDENGNYSLEAGVSKVYSVLNEEGILRGLKNKEMISFRYIIDTMAGGLGAGLEGKNILANLAKSVGKCTGLINFPSITEMTLSTDPLFCEADLQSSISKTFDTKYIPTGGNPDAYCSNPLTLPTREEGSDYIGIFSPFLKYRTGSRTILIPPAAHVANAFNSKYTGGDPYGTIANTNGILNDSNIVGVEYLFDDTDRDNLEPYGVNPIIVQDGKIMIYGDRTGYQDVLSDLNYLHIRELLNTIELECQAVLKNYVFKANNSLTRAEIVRRLDPILEEKLTSGALYSYNIVCDETNNTPEIINRAFGVVDIHVICTKNMEKIVQRIIIDKLTE